MTLTPEQVRVYAWGIIKRYGDGVGSLETLLDDVQTASGADDEDRGAMLDYITGALNGEFEDAKPAADKIEALRKEVEAALKTLTDVGKDYAGEKLSRRKAESSLAKVSLNLENVNKQLGNITGELAGTKLQLQGVNIELGTTKSTLASVRTELTTTQGTLASTKTELGTTKGTLTAEQTAHAATKNTLASTAAELAAAKLEIQNLLKRLGLGGLIK